MLPPLGQVVIRDL
jgi:hypothetical protein